MFVDMVTYQVMSMGGEEIPENSGNGREMTSRTVYSEKQRMKYSNLDFVTTFFCLGKQ